MKKRGFTLIEMLVSISILSIMMLFLYKSYSSLNISNEIYKKEATKLISTDNIKKTLFLDFSLAKNKSIKIENQEINEDFIFMQTANSNHRNYNPYVAYVVKDSILYRLESLKVYTGFPFSIDDEFDIDVLGEVDDFRVYKNEKKVNDIVLELYLIHIKFKEDKKILLKVKVLNEY